MFLNNNEMLIVSHKAGVSFAISASTGHHHVELLVVDTAVPVRVRLLHHGVTLLLRDLLSQVHHHVAQLHPADEAIPILAMWQLM